MPKSGVELAVERAIEGGWVDIAGEELRKAGIYANGYIWRQVMYEPEFWQSLGKAEGWEKKTVVLNLSKMEIRQVGRVPLQRAKQTATYIRKTPNRWKKEWHRFIDHLATGQDPSSFFDELLTKNK